MRAGILLCFILVGGCDTDRVARPFSATGEVIAFSGGDGGVSSACFTCHGLKGEGDGRLTPRLAGLDAGYLNRQLDDYATGRRDYAPMRAIATRLTASDRGKVAAYYAGLAVPETGAGQPNGSGALLYTTGDPGRGLQPCATCHGAAGDGDAGNPPLAGQPAEYQIAQIRAWRDGKRYNDPLGEMRAISRLLRSKEIDAVATHAAALPGAHPLQVPAASLAARRADPRNDASTPPLHVPESARARE